MGTEGWTKQGPRRAIEQQRARFYQNVKHKDTKDWRVACGGQPELDTTIGVTQENIADDDMVGSWMTGVMACHHDNNMSCESCQAESG